MFMLILIDLSRIELAMMCQVIETNETEEKAFACGTATITDPQLDGCFSSGSGKEVLEMDGLSRLSGRCFALFTLQ